MNRICDCQSFNETRVFEICSLGIVAFFLIFRFILKKKDADTYKPYIVHIHYSDNKVKCREIMVVQKKVRNFVPKIKLNDT